MSLAPLPTHVLLRFACLSYGTSVAVFDNGIGSVRCNWVVLLFVAWFPLGVLCGQVGGRCVLFWCWSVDLFFEGWGGRGWGGRGAFGGSLGTVCSVGGFCPKCFCFGVWLLTCFSRGEGVGVVGWGGRGAYGGCLGTVGSVGGFWSECVGAFIIIIIMMIKCLVFWLLLFFF